MNKKLGLRSILVATLFGSLLATVSAQKIPAPILNLTKIEPFQREGKKFVRYNFEVFNKDAFPAEMFAPAPELPPCGANTKASRTWLDFYAQDGKRLWGFCALTKPADLSNIWFALPEDSVPPSWVYIELTDRKTNTKYKSNLADTSQ